jgi:hypothetical protein
MLYRWKYFIIFAIPIFTSCNFPGQQNSGSASPDFNEPDTSKPIISSAYTGQTFPIIFEAAFINGTQVRQGHDSYRFFKYEIGKIKIETGKIIACDPIVMHDASPFTQVFPIGEFPVSLAMAKALNDTRVAFSRITFSDSPITKWEFALRKGQNQISLTDTIIYCYGVDAGTGIFIDSISNKVFNQKNKMVWDYVFTTKAKENEYLGYTYEFDGHNLATFSTGFGDGCYATYIGLDKDGKICKLLTDFQIVAW